jgi:hypothetical protein
MGAQFVSRPTGVPEDAKAQIATIEKVNNWQILDCRIVANYCTGIRAGNGSRIARCTISDNGHVGILGGIEDNLCRGRNMIIEDNVIEDNCRFRMNFTWDSGGIKFVGGATPAGTGGTALNPARDNLIRRNVIRRNAGPGIWFDWDVIASEICNNSIQDNEATGVVIEASGGIHIHHNQIGDNAWGGSLPALVSFRCSTVALQNSKKCILEDNLFECAHQRASVMTQHNRATGTVNTPKGGIYMGWFTATQNTWRRNVWLMTANGAFEAQFHTHTCSNNNVNCTGTSCPGMCGTSQTGCNITSTPTGATLGGNFMCFIPQPGDNHFNVQDGDDFRIASGTPNKWSFHTNSQQAGSPASFIPNWAVAPAWSTPPGRI